MINIGILALQGAFIEHEQMLQRLGVSSFEIRQRRDIDCAFDGLIIPGGESTVMGKLLHRLDLFEPLRERIAGGLPVFGTCAGMILLAKEISNDGNVYFGTMDMTVRRNAYGRQLGSFYTEADFKGIGKIPMTFIYTRSVYRKSLRRCGSSCRGGRSYSCRKTGEYAGDRISSGGKRQHRGA